MNQPQIPLKKSSLELESASALSEVLPTQQGNNDSFVGRTEILEECTDSVIERVGDLGNIFQSVFTVNGAPGIGKSRLLSEVYQRATRQGCPAALLDLTSRQGMPNETKKDRENLVISLLTEIATQLGVKIADEGETKFRFDNIARSFQREVGKKENKKPPIIILDNIDVLNDQLDDSTYALLEEWVLNPMCQNGNVLFFLSSRYWIRLRRFEVRRRTRTFNLQPFNADERALLASTNGLESQYDNLYLRMGAITQGHPALDQELIDIINRESWDTRDLDIENLIPQLVIELKDYADTHLFKELPHNLLKTITYLAVTRSFDVASMINLLNNASDEYTNYSRADFGKLISLLKSSAFINWDDHKKGYVVDPSVRSLLTYYLRYANPSAFMTIHETSYNIFNDWQSQINEPEHRMKYVLEMLYHYYSLHGFPSEYELPADIELILKDIASSPHSYGIAECIGSMFKDLVKKDPDLSILIHNDPTRIR